MKNFLIKRTKQKPLINNRFINKSFTNLQHVWNHFVGCLAVKKRNENQAKSKKHYSSTLSTIRSNAGSPWSGNSSIYFDIEDNINGHDNQTQIRIDSWNPEPRSTERQNNDRYPIDVDLRHIGVQEDYNSNVIDHEVTFEWTFVITNFALEVISTVLDQLSSVNNSGYAIVENPDQKATA
ncbi:hypothetical protein ACOSQ3_004357 [Xanthoceras sorbifolium]